MKFRSVSFLFSVLIIFLLSSCFSPPEFSDVPKISFNNLVFRGGGNEGDSLILSFDFQDGDGDLGLRGSENGFPFHAFDIIEDANEDTVFLNSVNPPLPFFRRSPNDEVSLFSESDSRTPFNCEDYVVLGGDISNSMIDAFHIVKNPNNKNIYVEYLRKTGNDTYEVFDWAAVGSNAIIRCGEDFNGRFPIFDEDNLEGRKPIAGTIDYTMFSLAMERVMKMDTFRLEISIIDRNQNVSNTISTPDFTLESIRDN